MFNYICIKGNDHVIGFYNFIMAYEELTNTVYTNK